MEVQTATYDDAWEAAELLRRSIVELCVADHGGDPARYGPWIANKTPETFARWIDEPANLMVCAVHDGQLAGVGALRRPDTTVMLIYVHPELTGLGAGRSMLGALETAATALGAREVRLTSTRTAHAFYARLGYRDVEPAEAFGMPAFRMVKELAA